MMLIVPYTISILFILFIKKTEKFTWLFAASVMAFLSITSITYADLSNYIPVFEYVNYVELPSAIQITGIGWVCLNKLFYMLGLNYRGMVVGMLYINYYLMHIAVRILKANENMYFGLFLVFPAVIQLVQFKFFTAFCLVLVGYSLLVTCEKFARVKFILTIVLATLIHTSSIMFIILLLIKVRRNDKKMFALIAVGLTILIVLFLKYIVSFVSQYLDPRISARYLTDSITPSSMTWIVLIFFVWLISFTISTFLLSNKAFSCLENRSNHVADYCGMSIEVLLLTLPFLLLDRNFHRFLEMGYSMLFVIIGMYITPPKYSRTKLIFVLICMVLLMVVSYIYCPYATVLKPIFSFEGFINLRR